MAQKKYENIRILTEPKDIFNLTGRVGLITGGAGKMGQQFAQVLSHAGAKIIIADINSKICRQATEIIYSACGIEIPYIVCDVSSEASIHTLFDKIDSDYGQLSFLISNVMGKPEGYYRSFQEYPLRTWKKVHDINLSGTFLCCREAAKRMEKASEGSIVITSSIYGNVAPDLRIYDKCKSVKNPYGGSDSLTAPGAYASSKGALNSFARYLAVLLAPQNIRVNVLTPGGIFDDQEDEFHNAYIKRTPMGRMAVWSDYNGAILFLVSEASRYMTGSNLIIDGGWTAW